MNQRDAIGFDKGQAVMASTAEESRLREFVNLKLASRGYPIIGDEKDYPFLSLGRSLLAKFQEQARLLTEHLCPADAAINEFLRDYLGVIADDEFDAANLVPNNALVLERHGIGRMLSLPESGDKFESSILSSYRVDQGICHNPLHDRRTTKGVFHVTEGGLPIPADKRAVPKRVFARLLRHALNPPADLMTLPFTANSQEMAHVFVSLLLRPVICPEVPGFTKEKSMEVRFFAPGNLVANLDFVESIFGNAGDPYLPENDARLDIDHWSGHTGCVILAPHLINLTKKELGLPRKTDATERQLRDGMYWEQPDEKYNDGTAFKITLRDKRGVIVTLIADSYFGYCKKEVKTQISYACNLAGKSEEEHAGGAVAFPSFNLGQEFTLSEFKPDVDHTFREVFDNYGSIMDVDPRGFGIDKTYPNIIYVPEDVRINLAKQSVKWTNEYGKQELPLRPDTTYVLPSGYKVEMLKPTAGDRWRLVGTNAEGTFCHKPCTVSGGGKSEISKSLQDAMIDGPVYVQDLASELSQAWDITQRDFGDRYRNPRDSNKTSRPLLDADRSLGSVVKLLTPNAEYSDEYNAWLETIPSGVRDLVLLIKRFHKPTWEHNWRERFSVDWIDGQPGNTLIYRRNRLVTQYLRVGFTEDGTWRTFSLRNDFSPAKKIQTEDDISVSVVVPSAEVNNLFPNVTKPCVKFVKNCEYRLFQRPDDAIVRGYDRKTEQDFSQGGMFFSNYEPLDRAAVQDTVDDTIRFEQFTAPMRRRLRNFLAGEKPGYVISNHQPRIVGGKATKNPRYLQNRPDLEDPRSVYLANIGARLYRRIPVDEYVPFPVNSVLPGRRNNPPDPKSGIRALAVYNPIHYQELPELFMDFIASLTGKSPSTTGAGSEGALTKGPFNALLPVHDLNAALVSYILTGDHGFTTAAGYIGRKYEVAHDISLLIPEVWSRMFIEERSPDYLKSKGYLEKLDDFEFGGRTILASRLGYRMTKAFMSAFFGRVFSAPDKVFTDDMLRPELQSEEDFVDGIENIVETQQRVAQNYFDDGSIQFACPPLQALLHIMTYGDYDGMTAESSELRSLFDRDSMLSSDWYNERLDAASKVRAALWQRHVEYLERFLEKPFYKNELERLEVTQKLERARQKLDAVEGSPVLTGTLGVDPALIDSPSREPAEATTRTA